MPKKAETPKSLCGEPETEPCIKHCASLQVLSPFQAEKRLLAIILKTHPYSFAKKISLCSMPCKPLLFSIEEETVASLLPTSSDRPTSGI
ncbi:unnamed protein product [Moneuplotes crassus]|uniref:Uncharacterized protein n=1 Tax=Euplotes crassus TaxID=5936 RepID=A0AAD1Y7A7_EUPCR|nr:unnamed protein product [Moneuplotes crassus]